MQHSASSKARTHSLLISSQALYQWATALLPWEFLKEFFEKQKQNKTNFEKKIG